MDTNENTYVGCYVIIVVSTHVVGKKYLCDVNTTYVSVGKYLRSSVSNTNTQVRAR